MTQEEKASIMRLRAKGLGAKRISRALGLSYETVKSYLRRHKPTSRNPTSSPSAKEEPRVVEVPNNGFPFGFSSTTCLGLNDDEVFQRVVRYHATMAVLRLVLAEGVITKEEFQFFESVFKKKYLLENSAIYT